MLYLDHLYVEIISLFKFVAVFCNIFKWLTIFTSISTAILIVIIIAGYCSDIVPSILILVAC